MDPIVSVISPWVQALNVVDSADSPEELTAALEDFVKIAMVEMANRKSAELFNEALQTILKRKRTDWLRCQRITFNLRTLLVHGHPNESLVSLLDFVKESSPRTSQASIALELLQFYFSDVVGSYLLTAPEEQDSEMMRDFVGMLMSVPDRIAFIGDEARARNLMPPIYYLNIAEQMNEALHKIYSVIKAGSNVSLLFLGNLVGRLAITGQAEIVSSKIFIPLLLQSQNDFIWGRITQTLFKDVPPTAYEAILKNVLSILDDGCLLVPLLGFEISNQRLNHLLTHKIFYNWILPPDKEIVIFRNILSYFCIIDRDGDRFNTWSQGYGQKYMALQFEMSVTKALLTALGILRTCIPTDVIFKNKVLSTLLPGVHKRLSSTELFIRWNGMIIGEIVTRFVEPIPGTSLKFEYPLNKTTILLKELDECIPIAVIGDSRAKKPSWKHCQVISEVTISSGSATGAGTAALPLVQTADQIFDSDDDLPCCDGTDDVPTAKTSIARPHYLQECYEGLLNRDDIVRRKTCLLALKELILLQSDTAAHMCEDLCRVLLGMELEGCLSECTGNRFECLVLLTVNYPKTMGELLGREARGNGFALGVRLEMLQIIRQATIELTCPPVAANILSTIVPKTVSSPKTRMLTAVTTKYRASTPCRFTSVAKFFILPLMYGQVNLGTKQLGVLQLEDPLILSHLINTLSLIILYAKDLPDTPDLSVHVLEFAWNSRFHNDTTVRQSVLFCFRVVIETVPPESLPHSNARFLEAVAEYISDIVCKNEHSKLFEIALQIQSVLDTSIRNSYSQGFSKRRTDLDGAAPKSITLRDIKDFARATKSQDMSFR